MKRLWPWALLGAALLLAVPASARDSSLQAYDLAMLQFLECENDTVSGAGSLVEDWIAGRLPADQAATRFQERMDAWKQWHDKLTAVPAPPAAQELRRAFLASSVSNRRSLEMVGEFLRAGKTDRASVEAFADRFGPFLVQSQKTWLTSRRSWLPALSKGASPRVRDCYAWQAAAVPLMLREADFSGSLQQLIYRSSGGQPDTARILRDSAAIGTSIKKLQKDAAGLLAGPAREAYLEELERLASVAEAVSLLARDPSPDSQSRLKRASRELVKATRATRFAWLEALAAASR